MQTALRVPDYHPAPPVAPGAITLLSQLDVDVVRRRAVSSTCSRLAASLNVRSGELARFALDHGIRFGVDQGAWPRRGGPPAAEFMPPPKTATIAMFEHEAKRRKLDPRDLAARCLDRIAERNLFLQLLGA